MLIKWYQFIAPKLWTWYFEQKCHEVTAWGQGFFFFKSFCQTMRWGSWIVDGLPSCAGDILLTFTVANHNVLVWLTATATYNVSLLWSLLIFYFPSTHTCPGVLLVESNSSDPVMGGSFVLKFVRFRRTKSETPFWSWWHRSKWHLLIASVSNFETDLSR